MGTTYRPYAPDQQQLFPVNVRDWLPEGHLVWFLMDLVDAMDLSVFHAPYEGDGRRNQPYHPDMMVKVLLYAYATGVFSSRKIAARLETDVAFRVLRGQSDAPSHRTIANFRRRHLADFQKLFVAILKTAAEAGLVQLGKVAIDGTKVRANASKRKAMSYDRMVKEEARLAAEVKKLTSAAEARDEADDEDHGVDLRGDELPKALSDRKRRLATIREAKGRVEARQVERDLAAGRKPGQKRNPKGGSPYKREFGKPEEKAQDHFTDPESRIMKTSTEGWQQSYNAQVAVDAESQLVVAEEVSADANDHGKLNQMVDEVENSAGDSPKTVLADAGYASEEELAALENRGITGYVALGREGRSAVKEDAEQQAVCDCQKFRVWDYKTESPEFSPPAGGQNFCPTNEPYHTSCFANLSNTRETPEIVPRNGWRTRVSPCPNSLAGLASGRTLPARRDRSTSRPPSHW